MAELQTHFDKFDSKIKLRRFKENQILRDKRDAVINKLREQLPKVFEEKDGPAPTFEEFDQGSYAMGTGVKPLEGDFDIDEGILFDIHIGDYDDPVKVKKWVQDALNGHTDHPIDIKKSCVRVTYQIDEEPVYHVDLPVYAHDDLNQAVIYLARGNPNSPTKERGWEQSDPQGLCAKMDDRFADWEAKQFRRCIRYLKRWRDFKFSSSGNAAPVGIGITVAAYQWFSPERKVVDLFANTYRDNDLAALRGFVQQMLHHFSEVWCEGKRDWRLSVTVPVEPYDDPFRRMTNSQMTGFKEKLENLRDALEYAERDDVEAHDACKELRKVFGDDFPVPPDTSDTGKQKKAAILTSSASA